MPGPYSSDHSLTDAREMAARLGIRFEVVKITSVYDAFLKELAPLFGGASVLTKDQGVTEENLQSRLRGVTLMALSNKSGALVLTTGNKSELAVGHCTLYGDMCGGLAVISDVPKTMVYSLSRIANRRLGNVIPERVFHEAAFGRAAARLTRHRLASGIRSPGPDSGRATSNRCGRRGKSPRAGDCASSWYKKSSTKWTGTSTRGSRPLRD